MLIVGTVLWTPMLFGDPLPTDLDNMIWDTFGSMQPSIDTPLWEGWRVDYSLYEQLEKAEDEQYFALHIGSRKTPWEESFVYEGKTFAEIQAEIEEKDNLIFKLQSLLKDGPHLKYGELLYTEGTPEGIKWSQSVYNKKISYYGKDFLAKYITDGEFYQNAVEDALSKYTAEARALKKICNESYDAYYSSYDESTEKLFSDL
ncbi:MAG: hypothetical protein J6B12_01750 [Clostridia bacterium]|nr:hypothetical protein [Clostridia bacterium]